MSSANLRWVQTVTHWGVYELGVEGGSVRDVRPSPRDTNPSDIGRSIPGTLGAGCRIRQPMVRKGYLDRGPQRAGNRRGVEPFVAVGWDTALDLAANALDEVRREHGNQAIFGGSYGWASAGRFHHAQSQIHRFLNCIGGYTASVNSYSLGALEVIAPRVIGMSPTEIFAGVPSWEQIAQHGRLVVAFGGLAPKNQQVNPGGVGNHSAQHAQRLCREAGVRFVNIGPLRDDAADDLGAEWLPLRPNTDTALMLALAHVLVTENLFDRDFVDRCCVGLERFEAYLRGETDGQAKTPEWAAGICDVPAVRIRDLGREIARERTLITVAWSLQRAEHGEQPHWMAMVLAALSGSMGMPGGGYGAGYGAIHAVGGSSRLMPIAALPQGMNPVTCFIPVARMTDMLLQPGESIDFDGKRITYPDVRLVYWAGGNPFHHQQDLNKLVQAWQLPETIIAHEPWWNALARHSDIVFPVATSSERNDFAIGVLDHHLTAMYEAVEPPDGVLTDYEVFRRLAARLGVEPDFSAGLSEMQWIERLYSLSRESLAASGIELPGFDTFWKTGHCLVPPSPRTRILCEALREDPRAHPLATPSGKLEIYSETIEKFGYADCPPHPTWLEPKEWLGGVQCEQYPLHLVSNQPSARLHSQLDHGALSVATKIAGREPFLIHPEDAAERGIDAGDVVRVFNERGACLAGAVLSAAVRRGVVVLATGAWYDPQHPGVSKTDCTHGNPNVLTADRGTSRLAQASSAHSTLVQVERYVGTPPPVRAFEVPEVLPHELRVEPTHRGGLRA